MQQGYKKDAKVKKMSGGYQQTKLIEKLAHLVDQVIDAIQT
jgi:hypothetical protein